MRVIQQEWKYFLSLLLILLVFSVAYYEYKQYAANKQTTTEKQPTVIVNTSGEKGKVKSSLLFRENRLLFTLLEVSRL